MILFGASLIARYETEPVALRLYGYLLIAVSVTWLSIWWYGTGRPHLLFEPIDARSRRAGVWLVAVPATAYLVAIAVASAAPVASMAIYAAVPAAYFLAIPRLRASAPPGAAERDFT